MLYNFESFPGLATEDFDAFAERKWSSNRFNLERMRTRAKLEALGKELESLLAADAEGLVFTTTPDHPHIFNKNRVRWLWLYLDRPAEERDALSRVVDKDTSVRQKVEDTVPQHHAAHVGMCVDEGGCSLFFRLHANALLDKRNLLARLGDPAEVQHLAVLLARLPEEFQVVLDNESLDLPRKPDAVDALRKRLENYSGWLAVERRFSREDSLLAGGDFAPALAQWLPHLIAIWRFGAWSRENDRLKLGRVLKEERKEKVRRQTGFEEGDKVKVVSGLLTGKEGNVLSIDHKGRVKVQFGRLNMEMEAKLLKRI